MVQHQELSVREGSRQAGQSLLSTAPVNISDLERWASLGAGCALTAFGLRHGKLTGLLAGGVGACLLYRGMTGHCHTYEALGIDTADHKERTSVPAQQGVKIERSMTINRPASELYAFWRQFENLPRVLRHLKAVRVDDAKRSHWTARGPFDMAIEWDAELINERTDELIAWRSLPGGDIETAGSIRFRPLGQGQGTEVDISLKYNPPAGQLGATLASWLGADLEQMLADDLEVFKQTMEWGPALTSKRQIADRPR
jgi:uncharacterized membrane protein